MKIDKILIAVDDTPESMEAANYGIELAKILNANVGVICVTEHSIGNIENGLLPKDVEEALQMRSDNLLDEINITHPNVKIEEFDPIGKPNSEIRNVVELWNPDILVIGHHAKKLFRKILKRSTGRALINHIKTPILIVPDKNYNK